MVPRRSSLSETGALPLAEALAEVDRVFLEVSTEGLVLAAGALDLAEDFAAGAVDCQREEEQGVLEAVCFTQDCFDPPEAETGAESINPSLERGIEDFEGGTSVRGHRSRSTLRRGNALALASRELLGNGAPGGRQTRV